MPAVDIIILSLATDSELRAVTERCLSSLLDSESDSKIEFNIVVIESNPAAVPYAGTRVRTEYPKVPFGYHTYMNIGIGMTSAPFVCLCNNDLIFHRHWASAMLAAFAADPELQSASPLCSLHHPKVGLHPDTGLHYGYEVRREVSGWCLFFRRTMLEITGCLDERFKFWFADNDYARTLESKAIRHALVSDAIVDHVESRTLKTHGIVRQRLLTSKAKIDFNHKWNDLSGFRYVRKLLQFYLKLGMLALKSHLSSGSKR